MPATSRTRAARRPTRSRSASSTSSGPGRRERADTGSSPSGSPSRTPCSRSAWTGRRHRVVRRPAVRDLAVGAGRARGREAGGAPPRRPRFEKIAGLTPDLIVGTNAGIDQETYDPLSRSLRPSPIPAGTGLLRAVDVRRARSARPSARRTRWTALIAGIETSSPRPRPRTRVGGQRRVPAERLLRRRRDRLPGRAEHRLPHRSRLRVPPELDEYATRRARPTSRWSSSTSSTPPTC